MGQEIQLQIIESVTLEKIEIPGRHLGESGVGWVNGDPAINGLHAAIGRPQVSVAPLVNRSRHRRIRSLRRRAPINERGPVYARSLAVAVAQAGELHQLR